MPLLRRYTAGIYRREKREYMRIIVGLGNPGREYASTHHNVGFMVLDRLAGKCGIEVIDFRHKALVGKGVIEGERVLLVKPQTYMNLSGESVRQIADYYKAEPSDILVIYDDVDLAPGTLRIRKNGSAGSHNGMKSIVQMLGTTEFPRLRVGIGGKPEGWDLADYVLSRITPESDKELTEGIDRAADAVMCILRDGIDTAMNKYNEHKKNTAE